MGRLRPLVAAWATVSLCAILQGAVTSKVWADAGWLDCVAVLLVATTPLAWLAGLLLVVLAPMRAPTAQGSLAGGASALAIYLVPAVTGMQDVVGFPLAGWIPWLLFVVAVGVMLRRSRTDEPRSAGHLPWFLIAAGVVCGGIGWLTPAPAPNLGAWPGEDRPASDPNLPNLLVLTRSAPASEAVSFLTGSTWPEDADMVFPAGRDVPSLATRLADRGYAVAAASADPNIRRVRRFARGFHFFDDQPVSPRGMAAAAEALQETSGVGRWLTAGWPFAEEHREVASGVYGRQALDLLVAAEKQQPFFAWIAIPDHLGDNRTFDTYVNAVRLMEGDRPWRAWIAVDEGEDGKHASSESLSRSFRYVPAELAAEIEASIEGE